MARVGRSDFGRWGTAWLAVAVLFAHTLFMGFHVPPSLRAALADAAASTAGFGICHSAPPARSVQTPSGHGGGHDPDRPAKPTDHLGHCPICLSLAGGLLGPAEAPALPLPSLVAAVEPLPAAELPRRTLRASPFAARAPPAIA